MPFSFSHVHFDRLYIEETDQVLFVRQTIWCLIFPPPTGSSAMRKVFSVCSDFAPRFDVIDFTAEKSELVVVVLETDVLCTEQFLTA